MKIALYARVSKDLQHNGIFVQNPANQLQPLLKWSSALGCDNPQIFVDYVSGGTSERADFQRMMAKVRQRHIDTILCWDLDRFSREGVTQTLAYIKTLRDYNCNLLTLNDNLNTKEGGIFDVIISILAYAAALERQKISDRTKAGLARARREGKKLGRPKKATME